MGVFSWFSNSAQEVLAKNADDILAPHIPELLDTLQKDYDYSPHTALADAPGAFAIISSATTKTSWAGNSDFAKKADLLLKQCPVSKACIEMRAQGIQNIVLETKNVSRETTRLLDSPNSVDKTLPAAFKSWSIQLSVGGDLWWFWDKRVPGLPQLSSLRQDFMHNNVKDRQYEYYPGRNSGKQTKPEFVFKYDRSGKTIAAYAYNGTNYTQFEGAVQRVSYYDPTNPLEGAGAGDSALRSVQIFLLCDDLIQRKFNSGGAKNGFIKAPLVRTDADIAKIKAQVNALNADGGMNLLAGGMDFLAAQMTFGELQLIELRDKAADAICTAFGVNSAMVNVGTATHANLRGMDKIFYRNFIGPEAHWLVGQLQWGIRAYLGDATAEVVVDETAIQHIQDDLDDKMTKWANSGCVTIDECRAVIGLPPLPNGEGAALAGKKAQAADETGLGQPEEKPGGETSFNADAGNRGDNNND